MAGNPLQTYAKICARCLKETGAVVSLRFVPARPGMRSFYTHQPATGVRTCGKDPIPMARGLR